MTTPTLLIVDDEKPTRDGLRAALEDKFDVYVAEDAATAMQLMEKESFDVLLTDLRMAGEDGLKLITLAKARPKPPVCILMTAYGSEDVAVEAMKRGADDYIAKGKLQIDELKGDLGNAIRPRFALADANKDGGIDAKEFEPIMKMMRGGPRQRPAPEKVAAK